MMDDLERDHIREESKQDAWEKRQRARATTYDPQVEPESTPCAICRIALDGYDGDTHCTGCAAEMDAACDATRENAENDVVLLSSIADGNEQVEPDTADACHGCRTAIADTMVLCDGCADVADRMEQEAAR